jgi:ADP-L-glycero-D-manno-heptose 6-epimerase
MIVVTGGAGFIGSNLIAELEARGAGEIAVVDWLGNEGKWRNLAKRELAAIVPPEDMLAFLDAAADRIDTIFHLGAISSTTETDADLIARTNIVLPQKLWALAAARGWRLLYASSAATYGDGEQGFDDDGSIEGLAKLRPMNPYGWSKHAFDRFVARQVSGNAARPRQWAGLKFFNVFGETARLFKSHRPDYPDGGQKRDFIWVGDCIDVMLWFYDHPAVNGLFNCGTGQARSFEDLALAVFAAAGKPSKIAYIDMPPEIRPRYQYFTEAKMERLRAAGYASAFTPLEEGVGRYVRDFLATKDPYR